MIYGEFVCYKNDKIEQTTCVILLKLIPFVIATRVNVPVVGNLNMCTSSRRPSSVEAFKLYIFILLLFQQVQTTGTLTLPITKKYFICVGNYSWLTVILIRSRLFLQLYLIRYSIFKYDIRYSNRIIIPRTTGKTLKS